MDFDTAFEVVVGHEGGYVNHPKDPGGETNFGITKRSYPAEDIKSMTLDRAKQIYQRDFWDKSCAGLLPEWLRLMHFDTAVNMGLGAAAEILQTSARVTVDGKIGPKTLGAVQRSDISLLDEYGAQRALRYAGIKTFSTFGLGWFRRLFATHRLSQE